jgi:hypothetical protein
MHHRRAEGKLPLLLLVLLLCRMVMVTWWCSTSL